MIFVGYLLGSIDRENGLITLLWTAIKRQVLLCGCWNANKKNSGKLRTFCLVTEVAFYIGYYLIKAPVFGLRSGLNMIGSQCRQIGQLLSFLIAFTGGTVEILHGSITDANSVMNGCYEI